jgi:hypothetical protein
MELNKAELYVVFAALCAMVEDNHSVQDMMTEEQWDTAEHLYQQVLRKVQANYGKTDDGSE